MVSGLFILSGCSFILRRGDFVNVMSAVIGSNFVIFALFYQIFYGSLTLNSYGDLSPEGSRTAVASLLRTGARDWKSVTFKYLHLGGNLYVRSSLQLLSCGNKSVQVVYSPI